MSDSKVGYKNPPKHCWFKKGKSGNPLGRPKAKKHLASIVESELYQPVAVNQNGKVKKLPAIVVALRKALAQAMKGDLKAIKFLVDLHVKHVGTNGPASIADLLMGQSPFELTAEDEANIAKHKLLKKVK
jgi:hypothetical protein